MIKLPDELTPKAASRAYGGQVEGYRDGWNACIAEVQLLNATAQPVSESSADASKAIRQLAREIQGVTPRARPVSDGWVKCSERMPGEFGRYWCYVEEQNSLGKSHYQWNCSWNGCEWSENDLTGRVTHWMPLPAAPGGQDD